MNPIDYMKLYNLLSCFVFAAIVLLGTNCNKKGNETKALSTNFEERIVLVDISGMDRRAITTLIERLSVCSPRVIGTEVIFEDHNGSKVDIDLENAFAAFKNVVIGSYYDGKEQIRSSERFRDACLGDGVVNLILEEEGNALYYMVLLNMNMNQNEYGYSLPFKVALAYDPITSYQFLSQVNLDDMFPLKNVIGLDGFDQVYSINSIECNEIRDRIVLLGDIEVKDSQRFDVQGFKQGLPRIVLLANAIKQILDLDYEGKIQGNF